MLTIEHLESQCERIIQDFQASGGHLGQLGTVELLQVVRGLLQHVRALEERDEQKGQPENT